MKAVCLSLLIALTAALNAQASDDVTIKCKISKKSLYSATYRAATGKVEVTDPSGNISEGETYQRYNAAEANDDEIIVGLAEMAGINMKSVDAVDLIVIASNDDGAFALVSYESAGKVIGKAALTGMSATVCK